MLSIFCIPKPFEGDTAIHQRNAIQSWTKLRPACQVILAGDEVGTKETAQEFGAWHVSGVAVNEFGTPLENSVMALAEGVAENGLMCSVASDIIILDDFLPAVQRLSSSMERFAMASQRWNLQVDQPWDFEPGWEEAMRSRLASSGRKYVSTGIDYLVYPRELFGEVPPFAVGRRAYDNWLLFALRSKGVDLVDATEVVKVVHQDHDYSHHPGGQMGIMYGTEAQRNVALAGTRAHRFILKDRTHVLHSDGIKRSRDLWWLWRSLRTAEALYPGMPLPVRLPVQAANLAVNLAVRLQVFALRSLKIALPHERTTAERPIA